MSLHEDAENLVTELENRLRQVDELNVREKALDARNAFIVDKERKIVLKQEEIDRLKTDLEKEKSYIATALEKTRQGQVVESRIEGKMALLKEKEGEIKQEEERLATEKRAIDIKLTKVKELEVKEKELERREALAIKSEQIDKIRKDDLDVREKGILDEAARLQRMSEQYQIKR